MTKKDAKENKGSVYLGHKLVEEMEWRKKAPIAAGHLEGSELTEFDPHDLHSSVPKVGGVPKGRGTADDLFPAPATATEKEEIKKLEEQLKLLKIENEQTAIALKKMQSGD